MEFFCGSLSGILLWLFIFHCIWSARSNARQQGGELIFAVDPSRSTQKTVGLAFYLSSPLVLYFFFFVLLNFHMYVSKTLNYFILGMQLFQVTQISRHSLKFWLNVPLEIRQNGVVIGLQFWPWERIKFCRFIRFDQVLEFHLHGSFKRSVGAQISSEDKGIVFEKLAPYVEIRDFSKNVISQPTKNAATENADSEKTSIPPAKYSFFQYDLRTLLLFILVVASFSSWYGILFRRMEGTTNQIAKFQKKFEGVECREYGKGIESLDFIKCKNSLNDEDLADLAACPQLECLYFKNDSLTDAGMAQLEKLTELRHLSISGDSTTDDELVHLEKLTNLEYLNLSGKKITDAGLKHLKGLKKLDSLSIYGTSITPEGTKEIQKELPQAKIY